MYGFQNFSSFLVSTNIWFSTICANDNGPYCKSKDAECFSASCNERVRIDIISNRWVSILYPLIEIETIVFAMADCCSAIISTINLKPVDAIGFGLEANDIDKENEDMTLAWQYIQSATMSLGDIQVRITSMGGHSKMISKPDTVFCISSSLGKSTAVAITLVQFLEDCTELEFVREIAAVHGTSNHTPWPHLNGEPEPDSPIDVPFLCPIKTGWTVEEQHLAFEKNMAICVFLASFLATMAWLRHWQRGARSKIRSADVHQIGLPESARL